MEQKGYKMGGAISGFFGGGSKADNSAELAALQAEKQASLAEKQAKQEELTAQQKAKARKARGIGSLIGDISAKTGASDESLG